MSAASRARARARYSSPHLAQYLALSSAQRPPEQSQVGPHSRTPPSWTRRCTYSEARPRLASGAEFRELLAPRGVIGRHSERSRRNGHLESNGSLLLTCPPWAYADKTIEKARAVGGKPSASIIFSTATASSGARARTHARSASEYEMWSGITPWLGIERSKAVASVQRSCVA
eukprot:scaffold55295_cov27-Tisochrysis_lutea.AAC.2